MLLLFIPLHLVAQEADVSGEAESSPQTQDTSASEEDVPRTFAIQNRPYILNRELGFYYSFMPLDHFNHFHSFGMNFLNYYNDYLAWEIFNAATVTKQSTGLEERLQNDYNAIPDTFDILQYYFTTNIVYTPIYMKHLYRDSQIRFGDISFVAGAGIARFEKALNSNMIDIGIVSRFIGGPGVNFKFDVRYDIFTKSNLRPNLSIGFVFTYNFTADVKEGKPLDEE